MLSQLICPRCATPNELKATHCERCCGRLRRPQALGSQWVCPRCGAGNLTSEVLCDNCGQARAFSGAQAPPAPSAKIPTPAGVTVIPTAPHTPAPKPEKPAFLGGLSCFWTRRRPPPLSRKETVKRLQALGVKEPINEKGRIVLCRQFLSQADLRGLDLSGADLSKATFWQANLAGAILSIAEMSGANLNEANLTKANLVSADLSGANLHGANLTGANLQGTNLTKCDLSQANLAGAHLEMANLTQAHLFEARLRGVRYDCQTKWPPGVNPQERGARLFVNGKRKKP